MPNYIPPNKHQVNLNFKDRTTGSTNLDFGADDQNLAALNVIVDTGITAELNAESYSNDLLDAQINTSFQAELNAVSGQFSQLDVIIQNGFIAEFKAVRIDQYGAIDTVIKTALSAQLGALFDINHLVGVSYGFDMRYQKAIACLSTTEIPWAKPILRVSNEALFYEQGLVISNQKNIQYEQAESLNRAVRLLHEQATGLSSDAYVHWEEGIKRFIHQRYLHEETIKLRHNRETVWQEMIRRRKTLTYSHEVAHVFEHRFSFEWDKGKYFLAPGQKQAFSVGSLKGVNFAMGDSKLGGPSLEVVRCDGQSFSVAFTGKMKGELTRKGDSRDLKALIESGKASHEGEAYVLTLESEDFFWVDLGGVTLEVVFQPVPKRVHVPLSETVDYVPLNIFLLMFLLGSLFVISALNRDEGDGGFADDLSDNQARIAKLIVKAPEAQKNPLIEKMQAQKEKQQQKKSGEIAAKHKGEEGQMGKKDAPKTGNRTAPKGDPSKKDQARALTAKIFGGGKGGVSTIFGSGGLGGELKSAMGNMFGAKAGDSGGFGGLGLRGNGGGGGGTGETIGIGGVGTKGRGGGTGSYGTGVGVLGGKASVDVGITSSDPVVMGSLDKELIRQVIHRNRGQIRFCYESQLNRFPKLNGKVAVKFVIKEDGTVSSSTVAQSTAGNAELESCVAGRVRTWQFPKPKGGGMVVVTYPFIFKQSGE